MIGDTASINLLTGLPGAGKSLRQVEAILHAQEKGLLVYHCNIDGLNVDGVMPWEDPRKWQELPAGSILFVDEAQEFFPARRSGEPPDYIRAMSKIRHEGVRLVLATQQPDYLDSYLRGLVGMHEHLYRIAGKDQSFIFRNHQLMDQVRVSLKRIKSLYDHEKWTLPVDLFKYYTSAQTHTVKYKMPALMKKVLVAAPLALALFGAPIGYLIYSAIKAKTDAAETAASAGPVPPGEDRQGGKSATQGNASGASRHVETADEFILKQVPRVAHQLWSAPMFDESMRAPVAKPELYCMSSGDGEMADGKWRGDTCSCLTEQGTRYQLDQQTCFAVVREGGVYNPYRQPQQQTADVDREPEQREERNAQDEKRTPIAMGTDDPVTSYGRMRNKEHPTELSTWSM